MAEIFIDSLKITDFGPFYGTHNFDFSAVGDRRAILIGGKNGAGKTHLLRALYLAAVGESGSGDLRKIESDGSDATKFDIAESLNRRARTEGRDTSEFEINLTLRDNTGSTSRELMIVRKVRHRPNSKPVFTARAYQPDTDQWIEDEDRVQRLRDFFLPRHLARFFFFDAERSQGIQLNEREITEGISRVLGLFSYSELEGDLRELIKNKIPQRYGSDSEVQRKLNRVATDIQRDEADLKSLNNDVEDKERTVQEFNQDLANVEDQLQTIGAIDPGELAKIQKKRDDIKETKDKLETILTLAWEDSLPVALLGEFRSKLYEALEREERRRDWENRKNSVEPKIPMIKNEVFGGVPSEHQLTLETLDFYQRKLEDALKGLFHPPETGLADKVFIIPERNELSIRIRNQLLDKPRAISDLAEKSLELDRKSSEIREMDQVIRQLNADPFALQKGYELRERRTALTHQKEQAEGELRELNEKIGHLEQTLQENRRVETNLSEQVQKMNKGRDLISLAIRYKEAVYEIKQRAAIQLREKISQQVGDLWLDITDRGLEFRFMVFDKDWNCYLERPDGTKIAWEAANTSAGQRQVRILAFTEALRQQAQCVPPLVVDTPLGRLDKEVKENVLQRLYLSGHQGIILTTNSEISPNGPLFEEISPKLARVYTLNPRGDQDSQSYHVEVSNDYFKHVL